MTALRGRTAERGADSVPEFHDRTSQKEQTIGGEIRRRLRTKGISDSLKRASQGQKRPKGGTESLELRNLHTRKKN